MQSVLKRKSGHKLSEAVDVCLAEVTKAKKEFYEAKKNVDHSRKLTDSLKMDSRMHGSQVRFEVAVLNFSKVCKLWSEKKYDMDAELTTEERDQLLPKDHDLHTAA